MSDTLDLEAIKRQWEDLQNYSDAYTLTNMAARVPALISEVERLRATVAGYRLDVATLVAEVERLRAALKEIP